MYKILFARIKGNCWLFNLLVNINLTRALITYAYLLVPIQWMPNKWFIYTQKIQLINWDFLWHTLSENRDVYCIIMWKFDIGVFHVCTMLSFKYLWVFNFFKKRTYIYMLGERERESVCVCVCVYRNTQKMKQISHSLIYFTHLFHMWFILHSYILYVYANSNRVYGYQHKLYSNKGHERNKLVTLIYFWQKLRTPSIRS